VGISWQEVTGNSGEYGRRVRRTATPCRNRRHAEGAGAARCAAGRSGGAEPDRRLRADSGHHRPRQAAGHSTWYLLTDLPRPKGPRVQAAEFAEVVRLYGLRNWVEPGYKQVRASWAGPTSRSAWTGRSADLGAGLLRVSLCWRHCLPSACPTRHAQLPGRPGGPPRASRGWRRACLWRALPRDTAAPRAPHATDSDGR
jgi:hypothetical protein